MRNLLHTLLAVLVGWAGMAGARAAESLPQPAADTPARPRIGLVLSGGGARGVAHVGVLRNAEVSALVNRLLADALGARYGPGTGQARTWPVPGPGFGF